MYQPETYALPLWVWVCILYGLAILFAVLTWISFRERRRKREKIQTLLSRFVPCGSEVIRPVVMEDNLAVLALSLTKMLTVGGVPRSLGIYGDTVRTEVEYKVNGEVIRTIVEHPKSFIYPPRGSLLVVYYDPDNPKHALSEPMVKRLPHQTMRQGILHLFLTACMFLAGTVCLLEHFL